MNFSPAPEENELLNQFLPPQKKMNTKQAMGRMEKKHQRNKDLNPIPSGSESSSSSYGTISSSASSSYSSSSFSSSCSSSSCAATLPIESSAGCIKFCLSNHSSRISANRPKSLLKTPKSVPNKIRPVESSGLTNGNLLKSKLSAGQGKPNSNSVKKLRRDKSCVLELQRRRKPTSSSKSELVAFSGSNVDCSKKSSYGFRPLIHKEKNIVGKVSVAAGEACTGNLDESGTPTPPVAELGNGFDHDRGTVDEALKFDIEKIQNGPTPPVQVSVSPEVQCETSSIVPPTPDSYGPWHAVYGAKSKKKCRPRGVLIVDDRSQSAFSKFKMFEDDSDKESADGGVDNGKASLVPSPIEALLYWHSSCDGDEKQCEQGEDVVRIGNGPSMSFKTLECSPSPTSSHDLSSESGNPNGSEPTATGVTRSGGGIKLCCSPVKASKFEIFSCSSSSCLIDASLSNQTCEQVFSQDGWRYPYGNNVGEGTPYLSSDSRSIFQTPQSNSSSDNCVIMSPIDEQEISKFGAECDIDMVEELGRESSSPDSHISKMGSQLEHLDTYANSLHLNKCQNATDSQSPSVCDSILTDLLEMDLKISWKDSMDSEVWKMNDLDCCRCFSDEEEEESKGISWSKSKSSPETLDLPSSKSLSNLFDTQESADFGLKMDVKCEKSFTSVVSNDCS